MYVPSESRTCHQFGAAAAGRAALATSARARAATRNIVRIRVGFGEELGVVRGERRLSRAALPATLRRHFQSVSDATTKVRAVKPNKKFRAARWSEKPK